MSYTNFLTATDSSLGSTNCRLNDTGKSVCQLQHREHNTMDGWKVNLTGGSNKANNKRGSYTNNMKICAEQILKSGDKNTCWRMFSSSLLVIQHSLCVKYLLCTELVINEIRIISYTCFIVLPIISSVNYITLDGPALDYIGVLNSPPLSRHTMGPCLLTLIPSIRWCIEKPTYHHL